MPSLPQPAEPAAIIVDGRRFRRRPPFCLPVLWPSSRLGGHDPPIRDPSTQRDFLFLDAFAVVALLSLPFPPSLSGFDLDPRRRRRCRRRRLPLPLLPAQPAHGGSHTGNFPWLIRRDQNITVLMQFRISWHFVGCIWKSFWSRKEPDCLSRLSCGNSIVRALRVR